MVTYLIAQRELQEEIADMISVCFEGEVHIDRAGISLRLQNGQDFYITVCERG